MAEAAARPHIPVLIEPLVAGVSPIKGRWLDGTFGAGGYTRALLDAGAQAVIGLDRDPAVFEMADWVADYGGRVELIETTFSKLADHGPLDGVVLDLGVSSMQLDQAERGFSFMQDGPLDMRMSGQGPSAADLVNTAEEPQLADILYHYGEERAARRIARAIVDKRPLQTTGALAAVVASQLPRAKPGQSHPATRAFQAIRIAVNDEFGELIAALEAAEEALVPGGWLAVVTFHSLEDRVVKRFLQARSSSGGGGSRYAPDLPAQEPAFVLKPRRAIEPSEAEVQANPRARSAKLRIAQRTGATPAKTDRATLGLPGPSHWWVT